MKFVIKTNSESDHTKLPFSDSYKYTTLSREFTFYKKKSLSVNSLLEYEYHKNKVGEKPTLTGPKLIGTELIIYYDIFDKIKQWTQG